MVIVQRRLDLLGILLEGLWDCPHNSGHEQTANPLLYITAIYNLLYHPMQHAFRSKVNSREGCMFEQLIANELKDVTINAQRLLDTTA